MSERKLIIGPQRLRRHLEHLEELGWKKKDTENWTYSFVDGVEREMAMFVEQQTQRAERAEAELAALKTAELSEHRLAREEAEQELAALKGRRCGKCNYFAGCEIYSMAWAEGERSVDFACSRWAARAEEGTSEDTYAGQCWGGADTPDERARAEEGGGE